MKDKDVTDATIFECMAGSHAYGTSTPTSDVDIRGVCIPADKSYYIGFGMNVFEQKDKWSDTEDDKVIYDLRKFLKLAAESNPNILDLLFCDESDIRKTSDSWKKIQEQRQKFLSRKARHSYTGYAFSQLRRIKNHRGYLLNPPKKRPERADYGLPEQERTATPEMIGAFQWVLTEMLKNSLESSTVFSQETLEELKQVNYIGLVQSQLKPEVYAEVQKLTGASDEWMHAMGQEKAYTNAMNEWTSYQNWAKSRNVKRAEIEAKYGYDTKHAMHLVRLIRMGKEILEQGLVLVKRPDAEELVAIRNGAWTYDQVVTYAENMEQIMEASQKTSPLPREPDRVGIDKLCQEVIENYVFKKE